MGEENNFPENNCCICGYDDPATWLQHDTIFTRCSENYAERVDVNTRAECEAIAIANSHSFYRYHFVG